MWGRWREHWGRKSSIYITRRQESTLIIQRVGKARVTGGEVGRKVFEIRPVTQAEAGYPSLMLCSSWGSIQVQWKVLKDNVKQGRVMI